jgi:restriction endonuclease S subunit
MLASVEELQSSTEKITTHLQRLNKLEADLKSLGSQAASRAEFEKNRAEIKRIVDGIHDEVLDVKKQVIGMHASLPPFLI